MRTLAAGLLAGVEPLRLVRPAAAGQPQLRGVLPADAPQPRDGAVDVLPRCSCSCTSSSPASGTYAVARRLGLSPLAAAPGRRRLDGVGPARLAGEPLEPPRGRGLDPLVGLGRPSRGHAADVRRGRGVGRDPGRARARRLAGDGALRRRVRRSSSRWGPARGPDGRGAHRARARRRRPRRRSACPRRSGCRRWSWRAARGAPTCPPGSASSGPCPPVGLLQCVLPALLDELPLRPPVRAALYESREPFLRSLYLGLSAAGAGGDRVRVPPARGARPGRPGRWPWPHSRSGATRRWPRCWRRSLPPLRGLRFPAKAMVPASLAWALLVGLGLQAWLSARSGARGQRGARRSAVVAAVLGLAVAGLVLSLSAREVGETLLAAEFTHRPLADEIAARRRAAPGRRHWPRWPWPVLASGGGRDRRALAGALAAAVVAGDLRVGQRPPHPVGRAGAVHLPSARAAPPRHRSRHARLFVRLFRARAGRALPRPSRISPEGPAAASGRSPGRTPPPCGPASTLRCSPTGVCRTASGSIRSASTLHT